MPDGDEVEAVAEVAEEGEADGVGRRAVDRVGGRAVGQRALAHAQRPHQGLLVADRALVGVGRDDGDVADRLERLLERQQAARLDAVVVGDEDPRPARPLAERPGGRAAAIAGPPRPGAAGQRLAPLLVEVAALGPRPLAGHVHAPPGRRPGRRVARVGLRSVLLGHGCGARPASLSSMSVALPGVGLARDADRAALALGEPPGGPSRHGPVAGARCEELEEERRHDRRDRDAEDRPRGSPRSAQPISTEPRTTIGWMPTAPCMIRGWRMFMTTNQPMPMRTIAGSDRLGLEEERDDDRRRPRHERAEERDRP